jgi:hypothetical protein
LRSIALSIPENNSVAFLKSDCSCRSCFCFSVKFSWFIYTNKYCKTILNVSHLTTFAFQNEPLYFIIGDQCGSLLQRSTLISNNEIQWFVLECTDLQ